MFEAVAELQGLHERRFARVGFAPTISRVCRNTTTHRRSSRASRRRWPLRGCCCPPADVLLLLRAAGTSRRRVVSVARSRRALGSRRRKMCEGTEGHRSACVASVLRPLALYYFFAFFTLFLFFCGRVGRIAAGAAGIRLGCHLGPSAVLVYVLDARGVRNTGQQYAAPGRQRGLLFLGAAPGWVFLALYCSGTGWGGV